MEAEIENLCSKIKDLETKNNELSNKCSELSLAYSSSLKASAESEERLAAMNKMREEMDEMKKYVTRLETESVQAKTSLHDQINQIQDMETKCRGEVSEKDVIIGTLQDELTTVKSDFETNKRELEELKSSQVVTSAQEDEAL